MSRLDEFVQKHIEEGEKKIWGPEVFDGLNEPSIAEELSEFEGATPVEQFFNYLAWSTGSLLHGSTERIDPGEQIRPGREGYVSATANAGITIMYSMHTNKLKSRLMSEGFKCGIDRHWGFETSSDLLELSMRYQPKDCQGIPPEELILFFAKETVLDKGYIYVAVPEGFDDYLKFGLTEIRKHGPAEWKKGFETKREWFRGKVYGRLEVNGEQKCELLLGNEGKKLF